MRYRPKGAPFELDFSATEPDGLDAAATAQDASALRQVAAAFACVRTGGA